MGYSQNKKSNWIVALIGMFFALILVFVTPDIMSLFLFNNDNHIAHISYGKSFILYSLSFIIVFLVILVSHFIKQRVMKVIIPIIGLILFIYVNLIGTQYSIYLDEEYIEYNPLFSESERYEWAKVNKVIHEIPTDQYDEKYIFEFIDGTFFEFVAPKALTIEMNNKIHEKILSLEVSFEEY
ncbi:hypothetical protein [Ureibacillus manganicus]|uniref:Uncharacterized protein n=1 Tax=Ureibacillus manganicus DSM 26584 TaxID=1384049 RepID=A0A0A3HML1_9BACL|nr:hypothetical protein [Ureibacillus manganicus]KGR73624.1 hypothetical protein CD29_19365 [Ureibacillus manganicus DSM 26584]